MVQITFTALCLTCLKANANSQKNLQLQIGDAVSIYSEKAYRKNKGLYFEAVGNVVIISGKDTLYGEKASLDVASGKVRIEGNVRYITEGMTIYGSEINFNSKEGDLEMLNARIITVDFNIVATRIKKLGENLYYAKQAEFTTCKDCTESWSIFGSEIFVEMNQYVKIKHALTKIKGVSVLYFPYIAIPIKNKRESGLLFPNISTRLDEGVTYQQPIYWAINDHKDMTFTPSFYGSRGYGQDIEYRHAFGEKRWLNLNTKFVNDTIYTPGKTDNSVSGTSYFRSFYDFEGHYQFNNSLSSHFNLISMKDLDMISDYNNVLDNFTHASDIGAEGYIENRGELFELGVDFSLRRNLLVEDAESFDKSYVQSMPSVYLSTVPVSLIQSDKLFLQNVSAGLNGEFNVFRQIEDDESSNLRNVRRLNAKPYIDWHFFTVGPVNAKTKYQLEYQSYNFFDEDQKNFEKYAGVLTTEVSFNMDKIFGLAYEESIPVSMIKEKYLTQLGKNNEKDPEKNDDLVGSIPKFEDTLTQESIKFVKNSYRHSQEFKFIHHWLSNTDENGNRIFLNQINSSTGWFDYDDALKEDVYNIGAFQTRTQIPLNNTFEFQWNNSLIRKSPKTFSFYEDNKFLRDNFNYTKIGYFDLSQGVVLGDENINSFEDRLTRLFFRTGYNASKWSVGLSEYFFHQTTDQITAINFQRRYDMLSFLSVYNRNTLEGANLETLRVGFQLRPIDVFGFSILQEQDLKAQQRIRSIYQMDFMPNNNCWILNLNYRETVVDNRYSLNWVFNFGNDDFKDYRNNFFRFDRLDQ